MYDLLRGIRVLEVALLSPDALGMHLADLGAEVIKVEQPPGGDYVREVGGTRMGGLSLLHLRWNRSKKSILLDLKQTRGRETFLALAARSQVVIDGLRAGALDGLALGFDAVRDVNPKIVYCTLNGTGSSGPYRDLATHGLAYDAYAGLLPPAFRENGQPYIARAPAIGIAAGPLYAALGVAAALVRVAQGGEAQHIEVAQMDCAAAWQGTELDAALNEVETQYVGMEESVRYQYYRCKDGAFVIFQASERKFWRNFCSALGREDLLEGREGRRVADHARGDEALREALSAIFATRTRAEWVAFFIEHDIAGGPVNAAEDLARDPHFQARAQIHAQDHPEAGRLRSVGPPIGLAGQRFEASPAPHPGRDTEAVLTGVLGYDESELRALREAGITAAPDPAG